MNTFILPWNPSRDSYKLTDFQRDFHNLEYGDFPWYFGGKLAARSGDNFWLVKTGSGKNGVVMRGFFISDPLPTEDDRYSVYLRPLYMIHPENPRGILSFDTDWSAVSSLSPSESSIMDCMWSDYIGRFTHNDYDGILADRNLKPEAGVEDAIAIASDANYEKTSFDGSPSILHTLAVGLAGENTLQMICGFLSGILDDPAWSAGRLRDRGFTEEVVDVLSLLTHKDGTPYLDYIKRIVDSSNENALKVTINDLQHRIKMEAVRNNTKLLEQHRAALELIYRSESSRT